MAKQKTARQLLEQFIIGAVIWGKHIHVLNRLIPDDFSDPVAKELYEMLVQRRRDGLPTDESVMREDITAEQVIYVSGASDAFDEKWNNPKFLDSEIEKLTTVSDLVYLAAEMSYIRKGISTKDIDTVDDALATVRLLADSVMVRHRRMKDTLIGDSVIAGFRQVEENIHAGRVKTGLLDLDGFLGGGIAQGEFVIIGARTNVGKSILSLYPLLENARRGKWTMLCSNEMTDAQMSLRMISNLSGVEMGVIEQIKAGGADDYKLMATAATMLRDMPIVMMPDCFYVSQIANALERRRMAGMPISVVVVDYIQNIQQEEGSGRAMSQYDVLSTTARKLLGLAKKYNCVIIAMSQVNRAGAFSDVVRKEHLEGSGVFEQTADKIFLLYGDQTDPQKRVLELAKNRTGRVGEYPFVYDFDGSRMKFTPRNYTQPLDLD